MHRHISQGSHTRAEVNDAKRYCRDWAIYVATCNYWRGFQDRAEQDAESSRKDHSNHGTGGQSPGRAALEYAARGIRINAICPGAIETPMVADMIIRERISQEDLLRDQPTGRLGRPEEIASAVLWLCSPGAGFVIGHSLAVDGGYTAR